MSLARLFPVSLFVCALMAGACVTSVDDDDELVSELDQVADEEYGGAELEAVADDPIVAAGPGCPNFVEDIPEFRECDGELVEVCAHHCETRRVKVGTVCVPTGTTCDPVICECPSSRPDLSGRHDRRVSFSPAMSSRL